MSQKSFFFKEFLLNKWKTKLMTILNNCLHVPKKNMIFRHLHLKKVQIILKMISMFGYDVSKDHVLSILSNDVNVF